MWKPVEATQPLLGEVDTAGANSRKIADTIIVIEKTTTALLIRLGRGMHINSYSYKRLIKYIV